MKRITQILFLTFFVFFASLGISKIYAQSVGSPAVTRLAEQQSGDTFTFAARTRKGASVYSFKQPNQAALDAIDRGLDNLFAVARKNGYRARLNHGYYSIYIARPDRLKDADGNYSPAIAVNAGTYAGGVYDQGGYIFAAGMVFYLNPDSFLVVDYGDDLNGLSDIVRYEGEHIILYYNNRRLYNKTANHGDYGKHPILN